MTNEEEVRARFGATAEQFAAHTSAQVDRIRDEVAALLDLRGDELVLDSATGAGALALALAPLVREVVGVDIVPELLAAARRDAPPNVRFVEGDATSLPFDDFSFDIAASRRTLHHVARPEKVVAELVRVTRPGGTILVEDQVAPVDPLAALELDRFESARDPSHTRLLPDVDLRQLFEANGLVLQTVRRRSETRALAPYLDLAGCSGEARDAAESLAPGRDTYRVESAWYVLRHG